MFVSCLFVSWLVKTPGQWFGPRQLTIIVGVISNMRLLPVYAFARASLYAAPALSSSAGGCGASFWPLCLSGIPVSRLSNNGAVVFVVLLLLDVGKQ